MSLIALTEGEKNLPEKGKAEALLARLQGLGVEIETGRNTSTAIAYSANGLTLRQKETVVTTEYVGLTKAAAHALEALDDDQTGSTVYYKQIGESGDYAAVAITTGTKTDYVPTRSDADDCWKVTKTETTYAAASDTGWSTTRPSVATRGIVISQTQMTRVVAAGALETVYQNQKTTVTEYPFLTAEESARLVGEKAFCNVASVEHRTATSWSSVGGATAWVVFQVMHGPNNGHGTERIPSRRYEGPERGWVVTVVENEYWGSAS